MKLMFVGKAGRGKTTLLRRISERGQRGLQENWVLSRMSAEAKQYQKDLSTVGIVVSDWTYTKKLQTEQTKTQLRNITFMTWDFGGQVGVVTMGINPLMWGHNYIAHHYMTHFTHVHVHTVSRPV